MNTITPTFSIKDLEHLCGVKAHTIRIWEKRYDLLRPERTDTNIRMYDLHNLKKLLNVTYLVNSGYKISRISKMKDQEIDDYVRHIVKQNNVQSQSVNSLKIAMLNYDTKMFLSIYEQLLNKLSFRKIFSDVFIPLLSEVGLLWQTKTISASHEHFMTNLIKQKMFVQLDKLQQQALKVGYKEDKIFVLFLPEGEFHDLSLLFLSYEIISKRYSSIFLGAHISLEDLQKMSLEESNVVFVSYFTISPAANEVRDYLLKFEEMVGSKFSSSEFWVLGRQIEHLEKSLLPNHRYVYSLQEFSNLLQPTV